MKEYEIIIETCKNTSAKYAYDHAVRRFVLRKVLPAGMVFPFDFGYINNTIGEDKQALDVIVFAEFETFPGCSLQCRIIGGISVKQTEKSEKIQNDRLLAIPVESQLYQNVKSLQDLPKGYIEQLKAFLVNYNAFEKTEIKIGKNINADQATKMIKEAKVE